MMFRRFRDVAAMAVVSAMFSVPAWSGDLIEPRTTVRDLSPTFTFGYHTGVKQTLGAYHNGLSVHQITRSDFGFGTRPYKGNPDYLFWVDERQDTDGIEVRPTDDFHDHVLNPGGLIAFDDHGYLWYTYGARVQDLAPSLYRSTQPYNPSSFDLIVPEYVTEPNGTTTFLLHVNDPNAMLFWRHRNSTNPGGEVRFRRYDFREGLPDPDHEVRLGRGMMHPELGQIGIEQLWSRHDPRFGWTFVTWQWFDTTQGNFGSNFVLYTDDDGDTWRKADGSIVTGLPLRYSHADAVLMPYDHLAENFSTSWQPRDLGVAPDGTIWSQNRADSEAIYHWHFENGEWHPQLMTAPTQSKSHACGATHDYLVFVWSDILAPHLLHMRYSVDGGRTWGATYQVDAVEPGGGGMGGGTGGEGEMFVWASFAQPALGYEDNSARFFVGYARLADGDLGIRFRNKIRWVKIDLPDPGDLAELIDATVAFGIHLGGDVSDLVEVDEQYFVGRSLTGFSALGSSQLDVVVGAESPHAEADRMSVRLTSFMVGGFGRETLYLRNWNSGRFEEVSEKAVSAATNSYITLGIDPAEYIRPGDRRIELLIRHTVVASFSATGFDSSFDQVAIRVVE